MVMIFTSKVLAKVVALDLGTLFALEPTLKKDSRSSPPYCIVQLDAYSAPLCKLDLVVDVLTAFSTSVYI